MMDHFFSAKDRRQLIIGVVLVLLALLALTGCQQEIVVSAAQMRSPALSEAETAAATEPAALPATSTLPPPMLVLVSTAAVDTAAVDATAMKMPSFAVVDPAQLAMVEVREEDGGETAVANPTAISTTSDTRETDAATLAPTFTPPALALTSDEEHYWLQRPIPEGGTVWTDKTYPYGSTRGGTLRPHHGVEFNVGKGTQILAAAGGTVVAAGEDNIIAYGPHTNFYGKLVIIELDVAYQGQPVYNLYGHLSEIVVAEGQHVEAKQLIALSGATGVADGPHLHFEVRVGQNSYDNTRNPRLWLYPFPDYGAVAGRVIRANGSLVEEAPISLDRIDASSRYLATTSYAGTTVNPDDQWQENFVIDDVPMGYYQVRVAVGEKKYTQEIYVFPYRTNFVEIVIEE